MQLHIRAAGFEVLRQFSLGENPKPGLVVDGQTIYGTTANGGAAAGTIYKINSDGSGFIVLHTFGGVDGRLPEGLTREADALYGATTSGGNSDRGTLYRLNKNGSGFTILHHFESVPGADMHPTGEIVIFDETVHGVLTHAFTTGAPISGPSAGIFRFDLRGDSFERIHTFPGSGGQTLTNAHLVLDETSLYGTAAYYATNIPGPLTTPLADVGTFYRINLEDHDFTSLRTFKSFDGPPDSPLIKLGDAFFGTTLFGGSHSKGSVYRVDRNGNQNTLYTFPGSEDGANPQGGLIAIGDHLFGITNSFGDGPSTLFTLKSDGKGYAVLHTFTREANPVLLYNSTGLVHSNGVLYGILHRLLNNDTGILFKFDLRPTAGPSIVTAVPNVATPITLSTIGPTMFPTTSFEVVSGPTRGTLSGTAPNLTYTPAAGFAGSDSFTFKARNEVSESLVATVNITVASTFAPGAYFGTIAGTPTGSFALIARPDRTGTLLIQLGANRALLAQPTIAADGSFSVVARDLTAPGATGPAISGQITSGTFSATIAGGGTLTATAVPADSAFAGSYSARALGTTAAEAYFIVANSSTYTLLVSDGSVQATTGPAPQGGTLSASLGTTGLNGTLSGGTGTFTGTLIPPTGNAVTLAGLADTVTPVRRLANISTRGFVGSGDAVLIVGFVLQGPASKPLLVRAAGPALTGFGLPGALTRPKLELNQGQTLVATNSGWSSSANALEISTMTTNLGAFAFANGSADAAVFRPLVPNGYTTVVSGEGGASGIALVEVYDTAGGDATRLVNLSSRGFVGSGDQTLIVGLIVSGNAPKPLLIRASGPALTALGLAGAVSDPKLEILQGSTIVAANDNWEQSPRLTAAATSVGAFNFPSQSKDAALVVVLAPGQYTVKVEGANGASGVSLAEIYELP